MEDLKVTKVVNKKTERVILEKKDYESDNMLYHSMVHNLGVISGQIDILSDKGYLFKFLKKTANEFQTELFKHTKAQFDLMENNIIFHHFTQNDYEFISDFLIQANPAQMTYLAKMIRESDRLAEMNDVELRKMLVSGEIVVEPETVGKSQLNDKDSQIKS